MVGHHVLTNIEVHRVTTTESCTATICNHYIMTRVKPSDTLIHKCN